MVNFGLNSASLLGIFLAVAGASLYFLRNVRPELARDQDIFFAAVGLLCGFILLFQGWRLDPILQFGQFLLTGSTIFFAVEAIRLRGVATEQARRNTPIVDDERPVSRVYRAELDQIEPYEEEDRYENPRLRGYQDRERGSSRSRSAYEPYASEEPRSSRTKPRSERYSGSEPPRKRRPRRSDTVRSEAYSQWEEPRDMWEEDRERYSAPTPRRPRPENSYGETRRSNRVSRSATRDSEVISTDYVDYSPLDEAEKPQKSRDSDRNSNPDADIPQNRNNPINFDY